MATGLFPVWTLRHPIGKKSVPVTSSGNPMTEPEFNQTIAKLHAEVSQLERNLKPEPTVFVAVGRVVMRGSEAWARARSHTFAKRIANALNRYTPNERGT